MAVSSYFVFCGMSKVKKAEELALEHFFEVPLLNSALKLTQSVFALHCAVLISFCTIIIITAKNDPSLSQNFCFLLM